MTLNGHSSGTSNDCLTQSTLKKFDTTVYRLRISVYTYSAHIVFRWTSSRKNPSVFVKLFDTHYSVWGVGLNCEDYTFGRRRRPFAVEPWSKLVRDQKFKSMPKKRLSWSNRIDFQYLGFSREVVLTHIPIYI